MRRSHFRVSGLIGFGNSTGRVTIEEGEKSSMVTVRPLHSTQTATMLLSDVAQIILERDAKARDRASRRNR